MTKQEFMAMSLPYEIYAELLDYRCDFVGKQYDKITAFKQWSKCGDLWSIDTISGAKSSLARVKPIIHPLSDLTKEIEHNGEKFVPIRMLKNTHGIEYLKKYLREQDNPNILGKHFNPYELKFGALSKLIKLHFDVASLIEKGKAIDVNSLEINPYK